MQHAFKNLVIAAALLGAGFLVAWLYFRPHLGSQGSFTDGVREYQSVSDEPLRYALWDKGRVLQSLQDGNTRQFDPCLSPDGRWMVFAVGEPGLGTDLWIAPMQGQEPGPARALFEINGPADELAPAFSDGALYFASNREGGQGGLDLYRSSFDDGELGPVEALPDTINSPDQETDPAPMPGSDGLLFASNRKRDGLRNYDLYLVYGSGPSANKPSVLATLSAQSQDRDPALTADGRTLFFASDRGGPAGRYSLYRSVLDRGQWLEPATVQGLETSGSLRAPQPSPNGFQLLYSAENSGQGPSATTLRGAHARTLQEARQDHRAVRSPVAFGPVVAGPARLARQALDHDGGHLSLLLGVFDRARPLDVVVPGRGPGERAGAACGPFGHHLPRTARGQWSQFHPRHAGVGWRVVDRRAHRKPRGRGDLRARNPTARNPKPWPPPARLPPN